MKKNITFLFLVAVSFSWSQKATPPQLVAEALAQKKAMAEKSWVKQVAFQSVGPTIMSGRVVDVEVNPENPTEFYVGYASGGVWHTNNNGMSFVPILDSAPTQNVGDIAVDWKSGTIWVGTGENNSSRSSYAGIGILKSKDQGKTWENMGLTDSHHVGKIAINPLNPEEVVVGVIGHLYSKNAERGVFKTTDGGKTWQKTLFIDEDTGVISISVSPKNFAIQYAAAWNRDRKAWNFLGNGATSGIYKSEDAGATWKLITTPVSGFPIGEGVGRIGLAAFDNDVVYAVHDNQFKRPATAAAKSTLPEMFSVPGDVFEAMPSKAINTYLKTFGYSEKYRAENIKHLVANNYMKPAEAKSFLLDANKALFETEVIGAEVFKSTDGGKTWKRTHQDFIDDFFYTYGYYFAKITVDPSNSDKIYIGGVPIIKSDDGGKTFVSINRENVHADHHIVWVNPNKSGHLINGNDGGLNISYDDGKNWIKCNSHSVSQFYSVNVDYQTPYNIYGGMQDNGVWVGSSNYSYSSAWHQEGNYPYESIMGGDGMQTQIDRRNPNLVYTGFQFGNYYRIDRATKNQKYISPKAKKDEKPLRFNWQTPILLSSHNQDILYMGSQYLHRSFNQGDDWTAISPDLTQGGKEGNVAYGTITSFSESPFQFGLLYVGSDDGLVHVSKDGGATWQKISDSFPKDLWVSRVVASAHQKERVYVALNGYRWDDFTTYIYVSEDYGQSWKAIASGIPASPVNVILEDSDNPKIVYVGTDNGFYVSFNQGATWQLFMNGLPNVAVHDAVIHKDTKDLIVGTHGRSIYKTNLKNIQHINEQLLGLDLKLFEIAPVRHADNWGSSWSKWSSGIVPNVKADFFVKNKGEVAVVVFNDLGIAVFEEKIQAHEGLNTWNYQAIVATSGKEKWQKKAKEVPLKAAKNGKVYLIPGNYTIKMTQGTVSQSTALTIKKNERAAR